ncbi:MAG TPA: ATP-binding protein [Candidatus Eisenbacteria bacterium]|nr:ATP-binding protein [Candidatus Eisenbacteria bacterium]
MTRHVAWAGGAALIALATAAMVGWRAGQAVERAAEHRLLDLVVACAASISPEEAAIALRGRPEPRFAGELQAQLVSFRHADAAVRSVFLLEPDQGRGVARVLLAARGEFAGHSAHDVYYPPESLHLADATHGAIVSDATASGGTIAALAPVRDEKGHTIALAGAEMDARPTREAALARRALAAALAGALVFAIAALAFWRARRGLSQMERLRGTEAQLAIYKVGDVLAGAETDEDLVRVGLESMASGTGIGHWAMYLREGAGGALRLFATRGLPPSANAQLEPDPVSKTAKSPASRAAWTGEPVVTRTDPGSGPDAPRCEFAAATQGLGPSPTIVSVPLVDRSETVAVLQCFVRQDRPVLPEDLALLRWMAAQVGAGLRRIRMERHDQMLALFTMGTGEILLGLDLAGSVTYANGAAERALGAEPGGLTGRRLVEIADFGPDAASEELEEALRGGTEYAGEIWFIRKNGTRFPAEVRVSPTRDDRGERNALVLLGHDVTERHEREAELTSRTEELALLNDQLQRAVGELEHARRAQGEFVANTSHELRTPLNAVIGFATLIEQGAYESDAEARDFALRVRKSAEHLLTLLNDILDLAKIESGRFQLSMSAGDLRLSVREALDAVHSIASSRGLALQAEIPDEPLTTEFDPARVRQVLINLLGNALKYTDKGSVRVRAWRDTGGEATIQVTDTGVGISQEGQRRLFSKFGRVDLALAGRRAGTGLGLAISKALIQGMGGTITVESDGPGQGTRATVVFPTSTEAVSKSE